MSQKGIVVGEGRTCRDLRAALAFGEGGAAKGTDVQLDKLKVLLVGGVSPGKGRCVNGVAYICDSTSIGRCCGTGYNLSSC